MKALKGHLNHNSYNFDIGKWPLPERVCMIDDNDDKDGLKLITLSLV